jgi:hypothetical protein
MKGSASAPSSAAMNGTRCAMRPEMKATSRPATGDRAWRPALRIASRGPPSGLRRAGVGDPAHRRPCPSRPRRTRRQWRGLRLQQSGPPRPFAPLSRALNGADDQWKLCSKRQLFLSLLRPYNTHTTVCPLYGVSVLQLCALDTDYLSNSGRHRPTPPPANPRADREGNRRPRPRGRLGHREDTDQRRSGSCPAPVTSLPPLSRI